MQISSSVIPLIEYMHIYHLSAIKLGLYIKHSERVCGRAWNIILGGSVRLGKNISLYVFVSEETERPVSLDVCRLPLKKRRTRLHRIRRRFMQMRAEVYILE